MRRAFLVPPLALLAACDMVALPGLGAPSDGATLPEPPVVEAAVLPPAPPPPPATADTAEEFDTTTEADREAARAVDDAGEAGALGTTLATLGDPADPGIWLKTPLVSEVTAGRVRYGTETINIELRPSGGAAGSGSQISLPAMRLLGAPLTEIAELVVFAG